MPLPKSYKLASGYSIPALGFGCANTTTESNLAALKIGLRLFDTAWVYGTERCVGEAIKKSGVPRNEIFLTTKVHNWHHEPDMLRKAVADSMDRLGVDFLDLVLIHWPVATVPTQKGREIDLSLIEVPKSGQGPNGEQLVEKDKDGNDLINEELTTNHVSSWRALEELVDAGKIRSIGVSNFSIDQIEKLRPHVRHPICLNQCEATPALPNNKLLSYCQENEIVFQAYSPLGSRIKLENNPIIIKLSKDNNMTPQSLVISWGLQRGTSVLTKSNNEERLKGNIDVRELSADVVSALNDLDHSGQKRAIPGHPYMKQIWDE